ncbi:hypothetical protein ACLMJK_004593 [Lecanora helva]
MKTILDMTPVEFPILPLTGPAGSQGSLAKLKSLLQTINPSGPLFLVNTSSAPNLKASNIAYLSCEPADYADGFIDEQDTTRTVANIQPEAIVFYSVNAVQCQLNMSDELPYASLYTMISANASTTALKGLQAGNPATPSSTIQVNESTFNGSGNNNNDGGSNVLGKSPTTAVAMIILYSITGIITALFLAIIIVGAVRAHRHPERYGPRRVMGRPRQSRARGIARAMLETIPIVKFGDKEDDKPEETGRDVELANAAPTNGTANTQEGAEHSRDQATSSTGNETARDGPDVVTTEPAPETVATNKDASDPVNAADNGLACSVCTDDFVKGQDIRVLPCKHKFHPECIDPWLLNVSGTCPLCRVDLHPTTSHDQDTEGLDDGPSLETREWREDPHIDPADLETPQVVSSRRGNRRSRILHVLNIGRMRHATPEERLEALRRLRRENQASDSFAEQGGSGMGSRFSRRVSRAFGGSSRGSRRASEVMTSRPMSEIGPTTAEASGAVQQDMRSAAGTPQPPTQTMNPAVAEEPPNTAETAPSNTAEPVTPEPTTATSFAENYQTPPQSPTITNTAETAPPAALATQPSNDNEAATPTAATPTRLSPIQSASDEPPPSATNTQTK